MWINAVFTKKGITERERRKESERNAENVYHAPIQLMSLEVHWYFRRKKERDRREEHGGCWVIKRVPKSIVEIKRRFD